MLLATAVERRTEKEGVVQPLMFFVVSLGFTTVRLTVPWNSQWSLSLSFSFRSMKIPLETISRASRTEGQRKKRQKGRTSCGGNTDRKKYR
jgi:hypothetical protein